MAGAMLGRGDASEGHGDAWEGLSPRSGNSADGGLGQRRAPCRWGTARTTHPPKSRDPHIQSTQQVTRPSFTHNLTPNMKHLYLILAFVGAVVPYLFFIAFFREAGINLAGFVAGAFANGAAGGFAADLLISSLVFWLFMFSRWRAGANTPHPGWFILLNLTIGLSCALPAFLYFEERGRSLVAKG